VIADPIESLILLFDEIDGDVELEDCDPTEECGDAESSLGATHGMDQRRVWKATIGETDAEQDGADKEPSLGAPERHPSIHMFGSIGDQTHWADGDRHDLETDADDEPRFVPVFEAG
jgi:hypothetical protein